MEIVEIITFLHMNPYHKAQICMCTVQADPVNGADPSGEYVNLLYLQSLYQMYGVTGKCC